MRIVAIDSSVARRDEERQARSRSRRRRLYGTSTSSPRWSAGARVHGPNEFLHVPMGVRVTAGVAEVLADHYRAGRA